jgi:outer membrane protein assembly factor BamE (lipoprotein component of BamABCDE complex)
MILWRLTKCLLGCILVSVIGIGCMIPLNSHVSDSRKNVQGGSLPTIIPGQTTREEILLTLGEPDAVYYNQTEFSYSSEKVLLIWFIAAGGGGAAGKVKKKNKLIITFDEKGRALKSEFTDYHGFDGL